MKIIQFGKRVVALFGVATMLTNAVPFQTNASEESAIDSKQEEPVDFEKLVLDPETVEMIRKDYLEKMKAENLDYDFIQGCDVSDVDIKQYCGTYNGNEVVVMSMPGFNGATVVTEILIGGHKFVFPDTLDCLYLHKDHQFIPLKNAYEEKLVNDEDLDEIANVFGTAYAYQFTLKYKDVFIKDWFYPNVYMMYRRGFMTGLNDETFGPSQPIVRAQFMVVLNRMAGNPKSTVFDGSRWTDITEDWYKDALYWGIQNKIMTGYSDFNRWGTADVLTREQLATVMYRYAEYRGYDVKKRASLERFEDASSVSGFAKEAVEWAVAEGIITGKDNGTKLDPQGETARAQCAAVIERFAEHYRE